ncbi:hypothetical protein QH494_26680 [Sphingomonas sp. AR_OL41]|uniref:hypothetical protein n=1 Tax=Sphingomonas sp. AR_OL41 TaxID=3042729 RepID=UPI0024804B35|nr:hypothetical protein [Sphingomonas sp. AR_OL41]MDH7975786.1 hypothetical protein [Sphingomonas sp. AR_OL41]
MRTGFRIVVMMALLAGAGAGGTAMAQTAPSIPDAPDAIPAHLFTDIPDVATVGMPELSFTPSAAIEADYGKYYYFHRADVSFATALADLRECDGLARSLPMRRDDSGVLLPNSYASNVGGLVGGAIMGGIGVAMVAADKRNERRANMRRCMHYKGYQRFGLPKSLWQAFNFEEGLSSVKEVDRQRMLAQQARVATTPGIVQQDLGL